MEETHPQTGTENAVGVEASSARIEATSTKKKRVGFFAEPIQFESFSPDLAQRGVDNQIDCSVEYGDGQCEEKEIPERVINERKRVGFSNLESRHLEKGDSTPPRRMRAGSSAAQMSAEISRRIRSLTLADRSGAREGRSGTVWTDKFRKRKRASTTWSRNSLSSHLQNARGALRSTKLLDSKFVNFRLSIFVVLCACSGLIFYCSVNSWDPGTAFLFTMEALTNVFISVPVEKSYASKFFTLFFHFIATAVITAFISIIAATMVNTANGLQRKEAIQQFGQARNPSSPVATSYAPLAASLADFDEQWPIFQGLMVAQKYINNSTFRERFVWIEAAAQSLHMSEVRDKERSHKEAPLAELKSVDTEQPVKFRKERDDEPVPEESGDVFLTLYFKRGGGVDFRFSNAQQRDQALMVFSAIADRNKRSLSTVLQNLLGHDAITKAAFIAMMLWTLVGVVIGVCCDGNTTIDATYYAIAVVFAIGVSVPYCGGRDDCVPGQAREVLWGIYILVGSALLLFWLGCYADAIVQRVVSTEERKKLLRPISPEEYELACALSNKDPDDDDGIVFSEFLLLELLRWGRVDYVDLQAIHELFKVLDFDGTGKIDLKKLSRLEFLDSTSRSSLMAAGPQGVTDIEQGPRGTDDEGETIQFKVASTLPSSSSHSTSPLTTRLLARDSANSDDDDDEGQDEGGNGSHPIRGRARQNTHYNALLVNMFAERDRERRGSEAPPVDVKQRATRRRSATVD